MVVLPSQGTLGGAEAKCSASLDLPKADCQGEYGQNACCDWAVFCFLRRPFGVYTPSGSCRR